MGKGDKKTKRGKIILGSYGVRRRRKTNTVVFEKVVKDNKEVKVVEPIEIVEEVKPAKEKKEKEPKKETSTSTTKKKKNTED